MQGLLQFLYNYRAFLLFVLLEVFCGWLIVKNNAYQGAAFFNSSNHYAARVMQTSRSVKDYVGLREVNEQLARENANLRALYTQLNLSKPQAPAGYSLDSALTKRFEFVPARVVNNTTRYTRNHLTIDKGSADGLKPGMGVICPEGVVGKIKSCSEHFSTVFSLLNTDMQISSQLKKNGSIGTAKWNGGKPSEIDLMYVPNHIDLKKGDTVVTSGYNTLYPQGVMVGTVKEFQTKGAETFYEIDLNLSTKFNQLQFVYVVLNKFTSEQDSLEKASITQQPDEQ